MRDRVTPEQALEAYRKTKIQPTQTWSGGLIYVLCRADGREIDFRPGVPLLAQAAEILGLSVSYLGALQHGWANWVGCGAEGEPGWIDGQAIRKALFPQEDLVEEMPCAPKNNP